ncbi:NADH-quinone oxidoreductase subunit N [Kribbella sp. NPDC058693]|uniref:NADH-quinone oxidoreductase subunit N n=1 Tax=Kribbella jiaozuonensis TaxID=2575441 RepID=A0A4U3LSU8_9ACTN|nr:NADH-quinone oxidoreductase subunit N [Kribbella jiaozuonensis]TKK72839.1 NADH-quinone oxidoreductase subunit N [Kribbella jiaozuonensis]TKK78519.1 NADH-quinone oxidoreductase subunit N [Kribbella jiaozuonensis]
MTLTWTDWQAIAVPLVLAIGAVAVLLIDSFWKSASAELRHTVVTLLTSAVLLFGLVFVWAQRGGFKPAFCRPAVEGPAECSFVFEPLTAGLWAVLLVGGLGVVGLSTYRLLASDVPIGEYHFLLLSALTGATVLAGARDLATLVIALEVVSLPSFAMVGLRRDRRGSEGAMKAFLVSVLSTAVMLFGVSYLYGVTGSLYLTTIANRLTGLDPDLGRVAFAAGLFVIVGFAFKIAAVPFHAWLPDTYVGAPIEVTTFLAVVSKSAGVAGLLVLVTAGIAPDGSHLRTVIAILAALTMTVGNLAALRQVEAVRLLAWSSIGQVGFLLAPLAVGDAQAVVGYLAAYVVVTLGAFGAVAVVQRHRPGGLLTDYRGMVRSEPGLAAALIFFLVVLAGLPPGLAGLFTKFAAFQAVIDAHLGWLAIVMALNVMIGLAVYLRWIAELFRLPADDPFSVDIETPAVAMISLFAALTAVVSVLPSILFALAT